MSYKVVPSKLFTRHLKNLSSRLNLSRQAALEVIFEIKEAIKLLEEHGTLPEGYQLHELEKEPWLNYMEFHILEDVLVVYFDRNSKNVIRMVGIYNHELLNSGKLD